MTASVDSNSFRLGLEAEEFVKNPSEYFWMETMTGYELFQYREDVSLENRFYNLESRRYYPLYAIKNIIKIERPKTD